MKPAFIFLSLLHIFVWIFVLFAFFNKRTAAINLYYIIPIIYILHIFPFHFINEMKKQQYPNDWEERADIVCDSLYIPGKFVKLQKKLDDTCFGNPIGHQGMLIFGALTSAWALKSS